MKKIFIVFIIMVSLVTFYLTRDKKIDESNIVTQEEIEDYKQITIDLYNKYGWELTEEKLNEEIQDYISLEISEAKSKAKGMEFRDAFKMSLILSGISCGAIFLCLYFSKLHYGELYGGHFANDRIDDDLEIAKRKAQRDFFEQTREHFINKISKNK